MFLYPNLHKKHLQIFHIVIFFIPLRAESGNFIHKPISTVLFSFETIQTLVTFLFLIGIISYENT